MQGFFLEGRSVLERVSEQHLNLACFTLALMDPVPRFPSWPGLAIHNVRQMVAMLSSCSRETLSITRDTSQFTSVDGEEQTN